MKLDEAVGKSSPGSRKIEFVSVTRFTDLILYSLKIIALGMKGLRGQCRTNKNPQKQIGCWTVEVPLPH